MTTMATVPVIAIDGPSGSGKGTVAQQAAKALGFRYLDSGAIYRIAALAALRANISLSDEQRLAQLARQLDVRFDDGGVYLGAEDVSFELRSEATGNAASTIAVLPDLRVALLDRQRAFRRPPGLVADGRDMGSVVFPDAVVKIFLTASVEIRAERRYKQLIDKGMSANIAQILEELRDRDARDSARAAAPLKISEDAVLLDTTNLTVDQAVKFVLQRYSATVSPTGR
jgi:cytidylate kinase